MDKIGQQWTTMDNNLRCYMHLWCRFYNQKTLLLCLVIEYSANCNCIWLWQVDESPSAYFGLETFSVCLSSVALHWVQIFLWVITKNVWYYQSLTLEVLLPCHWIEGDIWSLSIFFNLHSLKVVCTCLTLFLTYEELITFFNIRPTSISTGRTTLDANTFPEESYQILSTSESFNKFWIEFLKDDANDK